MMRPARRPTLFPYTTLFRSLVSRMGEVLTGELDRRQSILRQAGMQVGAAGALSGDRKSTRLNSSHVEISYAVFCLKKKKGVYSTILYADLCVPSGPVVTDHH